MIAHNVKPCHLLIKHLVASVLLLLVLVCSGTSANAQWVTTVPPCFDVNIPTNAGYSSINIGLFLGGKGPGEIQVRIIRVSADGTRKQVGYNNNSTGGYGESVNVSLASDFIEPGATYEIELWYADGPGQSITKHTQSYSLPAPPTVSATAIKGCDGNCKMLLKPTGGVPPLTVKVKDKTYTVGAQGSVINVPCDEQLTFQLTDANGCEGYAYGTSPSGNPGPDGSVHSVYRYNTFVARNTTVETTVDANNPCATTVNIKCPYDDLSGATFEWYDDAALTANNDNESITPILATGNNIVRGPGKYWVKVTLPGGCYFWKYVEIPPCGTTGGGGTGGGDIGTLIYPNPTEGNFTVHAVLPTATPIHIYVNNSTGGLVSDIDAGTPAAGVLEVPVDISSQAPGTYYVRVYANGVLNSTRQVMKY